MLIFQSKIFMLGKYMMRQTGNSTSRETQILKQRLSWLLYRVLFGPAASTRKKSLVGGF